MKNKRKSHLIRIVDGLVDALYRFNRASAFALIDPPRGEQYYQQAKDSLQCVVKELDDYTRAGT